MDSVERGWRDSVEKERMGGFSREREDGGIQSCKGQAVRLRTNRQPSCDVKSPCSYFIWEIKSSRSRDLVGDASEEHHKAVSKMGLWKNPMGSYYWNL